MMWPQQQKQSATTTAEPSSGCDSSPQIEGKARSANVNMSSNTAAAAKKPRLIRVEPFRAGVTRKNEPENRSGVKSIPREVTLRHRMQRRPERRRYIRESGQCFSAFFSAASCAFVSRLAEITFPLTASTFTSVAPLLLRTSNE